MIGKRRTWIRKILWTVFAGFVLMNVIAGFHAYKFTHFSDSGVQKTGNPEALSFAAKVQALLFGVSNPRPENKGKPSEPYTQVILQSNKRIEGWYISADSAKGTVLICHGFSGNKASMLDKSDVFHELGYHTFLIDFMGSGGSEGNQTTIGFYEAQQVCTAFRYLKDHTQQPVILFGTSMGAAAIMKAVCDSSIQADALILECPFGTMQETVEARFHNMHVPAFPMAALLVFWGGLENGFNAFAHNPADYAAHIKIPSLLMYGEKDLNVSRAETDRIFDRLAGYRQLKLYPESGHENYLKKYKAQWTQNVEVFLAQITK